ncbi:hypothetical protein BMR85_017455 [Achromobacter sp. KAs 3-5]|nr:hypothetical protein BMR85_017455 [Achromobacter sp. KAs 3-5]
MAEIAEMAMRALLVVIDLWVGLSGEMQVHCSKAFCAGLYPSVDFVTVSHTANSSGNAASLPLTNPSVEAAVLGAGLLRELYFRVLTGPQGSSMREALSLRGQFGRIGKSLRLIHAEYAQPLDVTRLANEAGMSVPSFHSHFKAVTQVSPMQYVKSPACTRLAS